ncbi:MAG: DUF4405 domain-containing protein [Deltaproteobacteria bacterium]|nr:DUF4405 domain-containing protein [Deltaproteobacteria bacterium]
MMKNDMKKSFNWRGLVTFTLIMGILVETVSGIVLYITPLGRFANWTNWAFWGLDKQEWIAIHTIFGYLLLIIIGLHLYFNRRVVARFIWSKIHRSLNLKREFIAALALIVFVFAGTLGNIPPFSSMMDLGREAKLSWEKNSDEAAVHGGRWAQSIQEDNHALATRRGGGGRWRNTE